MSRRVQDFVVIDRINYEQEHYKVPLNCEFDRNILVGRAPGQHVTTDLWVGNITRNEINYNSHDPSIYTDEYHLGERYDSW